MEKWKMENIKMSFMSLKLRIENLKFINKIWLSIILFALLSISNADAQSLDSLLNEAVKKNPQMQAIQQRIEAAELGSKSAGALPPPTLGVEFSQIPIDKYNPVNDALSNSISISQMFMLGGKLDAMSEVEKKNALVQSDELQTYKNNLFAQIKISYYKLWLIERKIEIQNSIIELLDQLLTSTLTLYKVNRVNQADALTIKSEIASNKVQLLILQREKESEIYKLNSLIGRKNLSKEINTNQNILIDSLKITQDELESKLIENNPVLKKMSSMIEMNEAMITAVNKEKIPDLMIKGMVMRMPRGMILTSQSNLSMAAMENNTGYMYSVMASITLPFAPWAKNKYTAKSEELAAGIRSVEYETENMKNEMIAELQIAISKINTSFDQISLYSKEVIPLYKSAAEAQTSSYQNGQTTINTVIDSYRMLLMQEMNLIMAKADYKMAEAKIDMMTGYEIKNGEF